MVDSPDPLDNPDPPDDPMLDALERSIEQPPGLEDPLAGPDKPVIDPLATQLDALEASIENSPPAPPGPVEREAIPPAMDVIPPEPGSMEPESPLPNDDDPALAPPVERYGTFDSSPPPLPQDSSGRQTPPNPPEPRPPRRGGGSRRGLRTSNRRPARRLLKAKGSAPVLRLCPESREIVSKKQCESCEKYRHWPEGTEKEPRECWHDWQCRRQWLQKHYGGDQEAK